MIKKLRIRGFQSHKDTELNFGPGVNMITGEGNDIGKTSIFRALNWVITNRPLGDGFISNFQDAPAEVEVTTDTAFVRRVRGKKENKYILTAGEFVEEPFTSPGTTPPEAISTALNFLDVNIQPQISLPFLVLDSPGQVAQHIREVANLDVIDKVVSLLGSKERAKSEYLKSRKKNLEEISAKLAKVSEIDICRFAELLTQAKSVVEDVKDIDILSGALKPLISSLVEVEESWIYLPGGLELLLEKIDKRISEKQDLQDSIEKIEKIVLDLEDIESISFALPEDVGQLLAEGDKFISKDRTIQASVEKIEKIIADLEDIENTSFTLPENINEKISEVEEVKLQYNNIGTRIGNLRDIIYQIESVDKKLIGVKVEIADNQEQFDVLLDQLEVCPACTSKLTSTTKQCLLESYKE